MNMKSERSKLTILFLLLCFFTQASDLYTIKKITTDNTVYIIIAERNDSLYKIVTPKEESKENHSRLNKLRVGQKYNLQLESFVDFCLTHYPWMMNILDATYSFWGTPVPFDDFSDIYTCPYLDGLWVMHDPVRPHIEEKSAKELITLNIRSGSYRVNTKEIDQTFIEIHNISDYFIWLMFEPDQNLSDKDMFVSRFLTPDSSNRTLLSKISEHEVVPEHLSEIYTNLFVIINPHKSFTISINGNISSTELNRFIRCIRINKQQDFMKEAPIMGIINIFNPPAYPHEQIIINAADIPDVSN